MVDEVVARERVDELALAAQVRVGDGDELAVARRRRRRARPGPAVRRRRARTAPRRRGPAGRRWCATPRRSLRSPRRRPPRAGGEVCDMRRPSPSGADTALTPHGTAIDSRGVRDLGARPRRGQARRPAPGGAGRQDRGAARAPRARGGRARRADRLVDDLWAGAATRTATRCSRRSPGCGGRSAIPSAVAGGDGGYRLAVAPGDVDALLRPRATRLPPRSGSTLGDHRGAAELSASALARFRGELLPAAGDWAAPHRTRLEEARTQLLETLVRRPAAARRGRDRRARGRRRRPPVPGAAVGAADHRALRRRPPGRRAGGLPAGPQRGSPTSSASSPDRGCGSSSARSSTTIPACAARRPGTCRRWRPSSSAATSEIAGAVRAARARAARRDRRARRHRQDGAGDRDRPRAGRHARRRLAGCASRPRGPPTRCSTR